MINNICENNKSAKTNAALKATISTAVTEDEKANYDATANNNGHSNCRGGVVQTTYEHGIWYSEIIDGASSANNNEFVHKQHYCNNSNSNNNNTENIVNRNVWLSTDSCDVIKEQQQQQSHCTHTNNECDIIIVDIEDDDDANNEVPRQQQQQHHQQHATYFLPPKLFMQANMNFSQKHPTTRESKCGVAKNNIANDGRVTTVGNVDGNDDDDAEAEDDDEDDSLASMETLSDNVSIWIDGEKHWVAGVDANTTCSELIWALLNYQNGQQTSQLQSQQQNQHAFPIATTLTNEENIATTNSNQYKEHELQKQQQQQLPKACNKNAIEFNLGMSTNEDRSNTCSSSKPNIQNTANTNNTSTNTTRNFMPINHSMPINTKENCKIIQDSTLAAAKSAPTTPSPASTMPIKSSSAPASEMTPPTLLPITLPPGIANVSQLATEYVIVKQYHHCEEYLDGSTKVFDVLPPRNGSSRKECELLLRHLGPAPAMYINNTPQLSSLISTDKDSGMGSPVGSARSAKFRRRKHKSSQWLAQANTLHPKLSRCTANERLMKIILAQDETIQRQLSLLREKERQITKIEEEKHRKRERELGKNYLLETYLNGLDEAECQPEIQDGEEIFIDETYHCTARTTSSAANPMIAIMPPAVVTLAAGAVTVKIPSATEALNMMAKHKLKDKEAKKEKKKRRYKEKQTKCEEIQVKDFNLKTNKTNENEKVDIPLQHHHELKAIDGNNIKDNGNKQEIEFQLYWLEKIYILNKQLQKEEELAAKLHAKVRKHQLRIAQQTQREAQMEIDKLDNNLALQCGDIRKVEANLMQTNEQLQKKLLILERLSVEYLQEQHEQFPLNKKDDARTNDEKQTVKTCTIKGTENSLKNDANNLLNNLEPSVDIQTLFLNNIKSKEEVIKLEKIIAKPSTNPCPTNAQLKKTEQPVNTMTENVANSKTSSFQTNPGFSNVTSLSTNRNVVFETTHNNQQQYHHQELTTPPATVLSVAGHTSHNEDAKSNDTVSTSCMFIDKNMLSSLHVQNAKTIKKQMFHTQTTATATAAAASATTPSPQLLSPPTQLPLVTSRFPKRQFQHIIQPHKPMASKFLTSRPHDSHPIQSTNIVIVQQPSTASSSCPSHLTSTSTSASTSTTSSPLASATAFVLKAQHPPTSSSPSPSIMAMNTVDISQLGTLV